jgi:hypothetical protein
MWESLHKLWADLCIVKFGWVLTDMIFLPFLPFRLDSSQNPPGSAWNVWGTVKYSFVVAMLDYYELISSLCIRTEQL